MSDIVNRLRSSDPDFDDCDAAADEIERLRGERDRLQSECLRLNHAEAEAMSVVLSQEAMIERLRAVRDALLYSERLHNEALGTAVQEAESLRTERDRLLKALHRISLASQNSMSSKAECGRIARAALAAEGE